MSQAHAVSQLRAVGLARVDHALIAVLEALCAAMIVVETIILFYGVVARYAFHSPLLWVDEVTVYLFVWLSMFGAALGLRRAQHMRLGLFVEMMPERAQRLAHAFGSCLIIIFLLALIAPAFQSVEHESVLISPALEIPASVRVAGVATGICLMLAIVLIETARTVAARDAILAVLLAAAAVGTIWLGKDWLLSLGPFNLLFYFALIISTSIFLGVPIAFAFGIAILAYIVFATRAPLQVVIGRMDEGLANPILLAVPLFVMLGAMMEICGLARAMIGFLVALLGHVKGGLYYVLLGGMYLVSGISGAKVADMAAIVPVLFPEMEKRGYDRSEMVAILAASGAMAETIPPSLVLITIGSVTNVSIAALFTGGLLPALVIALALAAFAYVRSRGETITTLPRASGRQIWSALLYALPAVSLPFVIRAAVVEGVATATEVSTIGIVYTLMLGLFIYRGVEWRRVYPLLVQTAVLSGCIMIIIATATAVAWGLTQSGFSRHLVASMAMMPGGQVGFIAISIVAFICLGSFLEGIPALVLFGPLLFPIAKTLGVHEVHYAMIVILAMGVGLFAPPFGVGFYIACALGKAQPAKSIKPVMFYLCAVVIGLLVVAAVPWISTGLLKN